METFALAQLLKTNVLVEEKFGEQNFRVLSEMGILAKITVVILNLVGYVEILSILFLRNRILGFRVSEIKVSG